MIAVLLVLIIGAFYLFGGDSENMGEPEVNTYTDVSVSEAKMLIETEPNLVVVDVSPHYDDGHLPGAINYYPSSELEADVGCFDKSKVYLVYCHADGPSRNGAQILVDAGLEVYRLESHYSGWLDAGYDVEVS